MWKTPEPEVYLKVYIFNITNRDDFLSGRDEKLRFQEVGPYVCRCVLNAKFILKKKNNFRLKLINCSRIIYYKILYSCKRSVLDLTKTQKLN